MKRQFLTLEKAIQLEDAGGILSKIEEVDGIEFVIGSSEKDGDQNVEQTQMLRSLCRLNKERRDFRKNFTK